MRYPAILCAFLSLLFGLPLSAAADEIEAEICIEYEIIYSDVGNGEDWWVSSNGQGNSVDARGPYVQVVEANSQAEIFVGYTSSAGDTGCTPTLTLDDDLSGGYDVIVRTRSEVSGSNLVSVYDSVASSTMLDIVVSGAGFFPPGPGMFIFRLDPDDFVSPAPTVRTFINIAAAASYSVNKRNGDVGGRHFRLYQTGSGAGACSTNGACTIPGIAIHFGGTTGSQKFTISHEIGHQMQFWGNGSAAAIATYSLAADGSCPGGAGWGSTTKEWRSAAAHEGFAEFYSASVWNDQAETDCATGVFDCEGTGTHAVRFMENVCGGTLSQRGTVVDWLRFYWDIYQDESLTFTQMLEIYDDANPNSWNSASVVTRLRNAAATNGLSNADFDGWESFNGIDP